MLCKGPEAFFFLKNVHNLQYTSSLLVVQYGGSEKHEQRLQKHPNTFFRSDKALSIGVSKLNFILYLLRHISFSPTSCAARATRSSTAYRGNRSSSSHDSPFSFASTDWDMLGIHPITMRSIPPQSPASLISASTMTRPYVHIPTRRHGLQATSSLSKRLELPLSRSGTLIQTLTRNPATTSEPSNSQNVNTGSNPTMPALTLDGFGRACKLSRITKGNPATSCTVE